jgi:hypothetical protein
LVSAFCLTFAHAREVYVATDGSDSNRGTLSSPFATLQRAARDLQAGDTCYLLAGVYHEAAQLEDLHGEADRPITIAAAPNARVIFSGTQKVEGRWEPWQRGIYRMKPGFELWQLFVAGNEQMPARWPNARFDDGSVWDQASTWANGSKDATTYTELVDQPQAHSDLAASGLDANGAIAILNIGSFSTYARVVRGHRPGSNQFEYDKVHRVSGQERYYYLEGKPEFIDMPGEWCYTPEDGYLYMMPPEGERTDIQAKVQAYAISIEKSSHVQVKGLNFFATALNAQNVSAITLENCNFRYPSTNRRMLGELSNHNCIKIQSGKRGSIGGHRVVNCTFYDTDGMALEVQGDGSEVRNCHFENIDYSCANIPGVGTSIEVTGGNCRFIRNQIFNTGASETVLLGSAGEALYNRASQTGKVQNDGAIFQVGIGGQPGSRIAYNWLYNSVKYAIRFDCPNPPTRWGQGGTVHHNVVWNSGPGIMTKGESHTVANNVAFDCDRRAICALDDSALGGGGNKGSVTVNNVSDALTGGRRNFVKPQGRYEGNWNTLENDKDIRTVLRDPDNYDFRPKATAAAELSGVAIELLGESQAAGVLAGAYSESGDSYWIAGRMEAGASSPVPKDAGESVPLDADLMWLDAYQAIGHTVYLAESQAAVERAGLQSPEYQGSFKVGKNVCTPRLQQGRDYFWRVDAHFADGSVRKGPVWSFATE